jgi:hypothetical protein
MGNEPAQPSPGVRAANGLPTKPLLQTIAVGRPSASFWRLPQNAGTLASASTREPLFCVEPSEARAAATPCWPPRDAGILLGISLGQIARDRARRTDIGRPCSSCDELRMYAVSISRESHRRSWLRARLALGGVCTPREALPRAVGRSRSRYADPSRQILHLQEIQAAA